MYSHPEEILPEQILKVFYKVKEQGENVSVGLLLDGLPGFLLEAAVNGLCNGRLHQVDVPHHQRHVEVLQVFVEGSVTQVTCWSKESSLLFNRRRFCRRTKRFFFEIFRPVKLQSYGSHKTESSNPKNFSSVFTTMGIIFHNPVRM